MRSLSLLNAAFLSIINKAGWTFEDYFDTYADQAAADLVWVPSASTIKVNTTTDVINFDTNGVQVCYKDLTSMSDTTWIFRCKTVLTTTGVSLGLLWLIMSTNTSNSQTVDTHAGCYLYDTGNTCNALGDVSRRPDQSLNELALSPVISPSNTTYYIEMIRLSATSLQVTFYSDSTFTTSLGTATLTIDSGIASLRYFKILGYTSGAMIGTVDNVQFANARTTPP